MKRILRSTIAACMALGVTATLVGCPAPGSTRYVITIRNISNQPLGPVAIATHASSTSFWTNGEAASAGIQEVAELGSPATLVAEMNAAANVSDVVNSGIPFPSMGRTVPRFGPFDDGGADLVDTQIVTIDGTPGDVISMASMLIGTNDGFWGVDSVNLPSSGGTLLYFGLGFDAGTEENDELDENIDDGASILGPAVIPGDEPDDEVPGDNERVGTSPVGTIAAHTGITGSGDIPAAFDWSGPVTFITITAL